MSVVSLPRVFVFRPNFDDPHPTSWLRVKLSCTMGQALYPHPQWPKLAELWDQYYPSSGLSKEVREFLGSPLPVYLFVPAPIWDHLESSVTGRHRVLGRQRDFYRGCDVVVVTNRP